MAASTSLSDTFKSVQEGSSSTVWNVHSLPTQHYFVFEEPKAVRNIGAAHDIDYSLYERKYPTDLTVHQRDRKEQNRISRRYGGIRRAPEPDPFIHNDLKPEFNDLVSVGNPTVSQL